MLAPEPVPAVAKMRGMVFVVQPEELHLRELDTGPVWAVIMETGYAEAVVSLVVMADNSVSLYFGTGGGIIGAGAHQPVLEAASVLLQSTNAELSKFQAIAGQACLALERSDSTLAPTTGFTWPLVPRKN